MTIAAFTKDLLSLAETEPSITFPEEGTPQFAIYLIAQAQKQLRAVSKDICEPNADQLVFALFEDHFTLRPAALVPDHDPSDVLSVNMSLRISAFVFSFFLLKDRPDELYYSLLSTRKPK